MIKELKDIYDDLEEATGVLEKSLDTLTYEGICDSCDDDVEMHADVSPCDDEIYALKLLTKRMQDLLEKETGKSIYVI